MERNGTHASTGAGARTRKQHATSTQDLRDSSVRQRTRIHCKEAAHRHQRRRRARNITHSSRAFRPNPGPRNTRTPGQPHQQTIRRGPAPSGKTCSLARDGDGEPRWSRGSRSRGRPWPAMGAGSPVGRVAVAAVGAPGPRWGRRAPPRRTSPRPGRNPRRGPDKPHHGGTSPRPLICWIRRAGRRACG